MLQIQSFFSQIFVMNPASLVQRLAFLLLPDNTKNSPLAKKLMHKGSKPIFLS